MGQFLRRRRLGILITNIFANFFKTIKACKRMRADASAAAALLPRFAHHL